MQACYTFFMSLLQDLSSLISGDASNDADVLASHSRDASLFAVMPKVVVYPKNSEDIQKLVQFINQHPSEKLSLTARSGGTDMSGGPLTQSISLDMSRYFTAIKTVGDHFAITEPGVFYRDFEKATLAKNLLMPAYPASREICTLGGMVNNNAGGEKTLTYGKTEKYVRELKVILSDGQEYIIKPLTLHELQAKISLPNFEGQFYRQIVELLDTHEDIIAKAKPKVSKNSTGYALWNLYDEKTGQFDLTQLFVGSQGTLGITTQITWRLVTPNPHSQMLVIFLTNTENLARIVNTVLKYQPESFESYDDHTLKIALKYFPQMAKQMGIHNIIGLSLQLIPELWMVAAAGLPKLILLAEFTGHDQKEVRLRAQTAQSALQQFQIKTRLTKNEAETKKYWTIRRESFNLLRKKVKDKHTAPFIDDLTVRPEFLPKFLPSLNEIMSHYNITYTVAGHVGDGNFHIIPLMDLSQPVERAIIPELADKVYDLVFQYHGSMSGEHNDGLIRSHYLEKMYGQEIYDLFKQVKKIFDPNNIFNPGKKVGADWKFALDHMIKE